MNMYQRGGDVLGRPRKYGGGIGAGGGSALQHHNRNQHQMYKQQHAMERQQHHGNDVGGTSNSYGVNNGDLDAGFGHHQMQQHNYLKKIERARERDHDDNGGNINSNSNDHSVNNPRIDRNAMNALRSIGQSEVKLCFIALHR